MIPRARPCLICEEPCRTEGQLCPSCAEAGHYVTDHSVVFNMEINVPPALEPPAERTVIAYAEAVVHLEALKVEMARVADEVWLSIYGPRD